MRCCASTSRSRDLPSDISNAQKRLVKSALAASSCRSIGAQESAAFRDQDMRCQGVTPSINFFTRPARHIQDFVASFTGPERQLTLRLI